MRALVYTRNGGEVTASLVERPAPVPGPHEVRVRVRVSGVNPIDWKVRSRTDPATPWYVPNHDGAGVIDAVGERVPGDRVGQRVWLWGAGWERAEGTAQELVVLPEHLAVPLPAPASPDLGASVGIPALTAHRCLTVHEDGPTRLSPGALAGRTVLVHGGAGAVGNAAIQLARWAGATVLATVSGPAKARLAGAAGAEATVNYRTENVVERVLAVAPRGADVIVEVAAAANAAVDRGVLARHGVVACYAGTEEDRLVLPVRELLTANSGWRGVFLYTIPERALGDAVSAVSSAVAQGALGVGESSGLPVHRFPLQAVERAHDAVQRGELVGKALIDVTA